MTASFGQRAFEICKKRSRLTKAQMTNDGFFHGSREFKIMTLRPRRDVSGSSLR